MHKSQQLNEYENKALLHQSGQKSGFPASGSYSSLFVPLSACCV